MPRILAIDDKEDNLIAISALLKNMIEECTVITALSGVDGISMARTEEPDAILLDIKMPNMDGYEVCRRLKADSRAGHIPVIMITAIKTDTESRIKGLELGADAFLSKPIDESELAAQVKAMLRIKKAEDLLRHEKDLLEDTVQERTKALRKSEAELRRLSSHLQNVREEERTAIAREIHDELGQSLTALKMDVMWMKKRAGAGEKDYVQKVSSVIELIDSLIDSVRRISSNLRPGVLDDLGLCAAVKWHIRKVEQRSGIKCNMVSMPDDIDIDKDYAVSLYRIFQEAMTNVIRHSRATSVNIKLAETNDSVELIIEDNGRGVSEEEINDTASFGIIGIRERVNFCGGRFSIKGVPGKGTTVKVTIPAKK